MGGATNPTNLNVAPRYLEHGEQEAGTSNIITGILFNYRGYDTLGEVAIISAAAAGVIAVLGQSKKNSRVFVDQVDIKLSFIIRTAVKLLMPVIILFAIFIVAFSSTLPGGGFQGGAIIGAGTIIFTTVFGFHEATNRISSRFKKIAGSAAIVAFFFVGTIGVIGGTNFLTYVLPQLSIHTQPAIRTLMLYVIQFGVGIEVGIIFTSIFFALLGDGEPNDVEYAR
jgi:multicomponent Na+:H+ antiporter subunit B